MQFHTREPRGIFLFLGSSDSSHECIGLELFNSDIYAFGQMLGKEFRVQLNPEEVIVSAGKFHKVSIQMNSNNYLTMQLDNYPVSQQIQTPGKLDFESYTYIGGIDSLSRLPWQAYSHHGFAGCINYLRVNDGQFIDILQYSKLTDMRGIQTGVCHTTTARCLPGICGPGKCYERSYNLLDNSKNYYCDCSGTSKSYSFTAVDILRGEECTIDATKFICNSKSFLLYIFEREKVTHFDEISVDFNTKSMKDSLFLMKSGTGEAIDTFISAEVIAGQVFVVISLYKNKNEKSTFTAKKKNLNDGQWHTLKLLRYNENIELYVDEIKTRIKGTLHRYENHEKFFNRVKEIFLGSITRQPGTDKCEGQLRNFYWHEFNLLGIKYRDGQYFSQMISDKSILPMLPPFPRQPPRPCTVKPTHQYSVLNNIHIPMTSGIFMIEFKTKFNGIIWHAISSYQSDQWMAIVISSNSIILLYSFQSVQGIRIIEVTRGGITIKDGTWHKIVVELNKLKGIISMHIDDIESLSSEIIIPELINQVSNMRSMVFNLGGIQNDNQYKSFLKVFNEKSADIAKEFVDRNEFKFVGCFGDLLINSNNFSTNLLNEELYTFPPKSMICRACQDNMVKCHKNYCQNGGRCNNINDNQITCDCQGTGFYGKQCDIKNPVCTPSSCRNGGLCQIIGNHKVCNCTGTGFVGSECEINRCENLKCMNNGICKIKQGFAECDCSLTQYSGFNCEIPKCPSGFCLSNGQCLIDKISLRPYCVCNGTGYTGNRCENPICSPERCNRNGKCFVRNNNPVCFCREEYIGDRCEKKICSADECLNGGTCRVVDRKPLCTCSEFYQGLRCEKTKPCPVGYCLYGGECQIINGAPKCNCSKTDYMGNRCEKPKNCPDKYCSNGGICSIVGNNMVCNCLNTGYSGDRCTSKIGCPVGYCHNGGICQITNGKFTCDCSAIPYSGDLCHQRANGIFCDYKKPGYTAMSFKPPTISEGMIISMGFQTFLGTGTIFCFETAGDKYWSVKLAEGRPVVDINGMVFYMKTVVNDGRFHVIRVSRDTTNFIVTVDNTTIDTLLIPTQMTSILTLPNNIIIYSKLTLCNSCPDAKDEDRFQGAIGNFRFGGQFISNQIKNGGSAMIGGVQHIQMPMIPLLPVPNIQPCTLDYCQNDGNCSIRNYGPSCNCGLNGFTGNRCDKRIFIIKPVPPTPGYVIANIVPSSASNVDIMGFLAQWSHSTSPLMTWVTDKGNFLEIKVKNGMIHMNNNGELVGPLNSQSLLKNTPHFFKLVNLLGRLTVYVNGTKLGHIKLSEPLLMKNDSIHLSKVIIGANQKLDEIVKGFIGNYQHNEFQLIDPKGSLRAPAVPIHTIKIEPWIKVKRKLIAPSKISIGSHGGIILGHSAIFLSEGFGAGAIIQISGGPFIVGAQMFSIGTLSVNPLILGLILASILFLMALIWALGNFVFRTGHTSAFANGILVGGGADSMTSPLLFSNGMALGHVTSGINDHEQIIVGTTRSAKDQLDFSGTNRFRGDINTGLGAASLESANRTNDLYVTAGYANSTGIHGKTDTALASERTNLSSMNRTDDLYKVSGGINSTNTMRRNELIPNSGTTNLETLNRSTFGTKGHNTLISPSKNVNIESIQSSKHGNNYAAQDGYSYQAMPQINVFTESELKLDCCLLTNDSKYAITGSVSGPPQIWDLSSGSLIHLLDGENQACTSLYLAMNDTILVGLVNQNQYQINLKILKMWNFPEGQIVEFENEIYCTTCYLSHDRKSLIIAEDMNKSLITIFNFMNGKSRAITYSKTEYISTEGIQLLKISTKSRFIIAGYQTGINQSVYMVFDLNKVKMEEIGSIKMNSNIHCCELISENEAVIGTLNGELIIWNLLPMQVVRQIALNHPSTASPIVPHEGPINCIAISKDQSVLITGGLDSRVKVWSMDNENLLHSWDKHEDEVQSLAISNDNEIIVSGSVDGSIRIWNINLEQELCSFSSNIEINKVLLSEDKTIIVGLGERAGVNKLVMLRILRNIHQVQWNISAS